MNVIANKIYVDAGLIMVADPDYLGSCPSPDTKDLKRLGKVFDIPNGKYRVTWRIRDSYNGDIEGVEEIEITSKKCLICDPCYIIGQAKHEDWLKWLEDNNYGDSLDASQAFLITETGGDGVFEVELNFDLKEE